MPEKDEYEKGHKYPYYSCEILCSMNGFNLEKILNTYNDDDDDDDDDDKDDDKDDNNDNDKDTDNKDIYILLHIHLFLAFLYNNLSVYLYYPQSYYYIRKYYYMINYLHIFKPT
jgi:hypothetical protein